MSGWRWRARRVDEAFYALFADAAQHLVDGSAILAELLADGADRHEIATRMREAEHAADETTHAIASRVGTGVGLPFERQDVYALASALDDVMDHMEEAVDLVVLYGVRLLPEEVADQVEVLQRCAELTVEAVPRLRTMSDLHEYCIEINRLENAGDKSFRSILALLFGGAYDALEVLRLKDVVEALEAAIDAFETVAELVEQVQAKNA